MPALSVVRILGWGRNRSNSTPLPSQRTMCRSKGWITSGTTHRLSSSASGSPEPEVMITSLGPGPSCTVCSSTSSSVMTSRAPAGRSKGRRRVITAGLPRTRAETETSRTGSRPKLRSDSSLGGSNRLAPPRTASKPTLAGRSSPTSIQRRRRGAPASSDSGRSVIRLSAPTPREADSAVRADRRWSMGAATAVTCRRSSCAMASGRSPTKGTSSPRLVRLRIATLAPSAMARSISPRAASTARSKRDWPPPASACIEAEVSTTISRLGAGSKADSPSAISAMTANISA